MTRVRFHAGRRRVSGGLKAASLACLVVLGCAVPPVASQERQAGFIVWNLPPKDSDAYRRLRDLAGAAEGRVLDKTGAEIWAVEADRAPALRRAATDEGVQLREIEAPPTPLFSAVAARVEGDETPPPLQTHTPMVQRAMRSNAVTSVTLLSLMPQPVIEYALTRPAAPGMTSEGEADVLIQLGPETAVHARRTHMQSHANKVFWYGKTLDDGLPVSLMWAPDGRFAGTLKHGGKDYVIKTMEGGLHAVLAVDADRMPSDHPQPGASHQEGQPSGRTRRIDRSGEDRRNLEDAPENAAAPPALVPELIPAPPLDTFQPAEITVLFVYTRAAANHYRDIRMELIDLAVEQTNQSFRSSGIDHVRVAIAGTYQVDYKEDGGGVFDHLWNLADRGDGHMDDVHRLRDDTHADIVVLIVDSPDACGLATRVNADADEAFAAVHHACAMTSYSIPHEIGHLLGGRHDRAIDDSPRPFPFGHGFVNGEKWRTIMAYKGSCHGCPRLPIWSNPNILIEGEPAGDALTYDARVVAEQAVRVAAFR